MSSDEYRTVTADDGRELTPTVLLEPMTWTPLPGLDVDVLAPDVVVLSYRPTPTRVAADAEMWIQRAERHDLTEDEERALMQVLHHFGLGGYEAGGFRTRLIQAISAADLANRARLAVVFPAQVGFFNAVLHAPDGSARLVAAVESA